MLAKYDIPQIPGLPRIVFRIAVFGITDRRDQECERESESVLFLYLRAALV